MYQNVINNGLSQSDYALYQVALINGINNPAEKIKTFNTLSTLSAKRSVLKSYLQIANAYMVRKILRCHSVSQ